MQRMLHAPTDTRRLDTRQSLPTTARHDGRWLLLIDHLPTQPSSARSAIWRGTKRLGARSL